MKDTSWKTVFDTDEKKNIHQFESRRFQVITDQENQKIDVVKDNKIIESYDEENMSVEAYHRVLTHIGRYDYELMKDSINESKPEHYKKLDTIEAVA